MKITIKYWIIIFISLALIPGIWACSGNKNKKSYNEVSIEGLTEFEFNKELHNFGNLISGEIVIYSFVVKNAGSKNLVIKNVESDCGCINVDYSNIPIKPGEKGIIEVEFNTSGLFGRQYKPIAIEMNTKEKIIYLAVAAEIKNEQLEINY
ncbi:MAG: DUF1573 domain-containing protein [Mariniphaga sp.]|nr:DUF1573 domain-containing protein [Mariniphaga sp.]